MDLTDATAEMFRLSAKIDQGLDALRAYAHQSATAERDYRKLKSECWVNAPRERGGMRLTAGEREAVVNGDTADARFARDLAVDMRQTALEAVRSRRAQLSALQSILAADRAEAEFARTG